MGLQSGSRLLQRRRNAKRGRLVAALMLSIAGAVFLLVGVFEAPTVLTVLCLAPISIALCYVTARSSLTEHI
jgi:hypothetical protein